MFLIEVNDEKRLNDFIGENLRDAREARGFTVEYLAKKTGLLKQQIKRFESGKLKPRLKDFLKFNDELKMPLKFYSKKFISKSENPIFVCGKYGCDIL